MKLANFKVRDREARSPTREGACAPRSYAEQTADPGLIELSCSVAVFEEYRRYFLLEPQELIVRKVSDVAGGGQFVLR